MSHNDNLSCLLHMCCDWHNFYKSCWNCSAHTKSMPKSCKKALWLRLKDTFFRLWNSHGIESIVFTVVEVRERFWFQLYDNKKSVCEILMTLNVWESCTGTQIFSYLTHVDCHKKWHSCPCAQSLMITCCYYLKNCCDTALMHLMCSG